MKSVSIICLLFCLILAISCGTITGSEAGQSQIFVTTPENELIFEPEIEPDVEPDSLFEVKTSSPPIDISEVIFCLSEHRDTLVFDKNGLEIPEIRELFQNDLDEFENREFKASYVESYLEVAEYDLNGDGIAEYIVKYPHPSQPGGTAWNPAFLDIVCKQENGELQRQNTNIVMLFQFNELVVLNTATNGYFDIVEKTASSHKFIIQFNGYYYESVDFENEYRVIYDRILSTYEDNYALENNTVALKYHFRVSASDNNEYYFYIAGLFYTAEKMGIVSNDRIWACDEKGSPKVFSTDDILVWLSDVIFRDEYAGAEINQDPIESIWPDEVRFVVCDA